MVKFDCGWMNIEGIFVWQAQRAKISVYHLISIYIFLDSQLRNQNTTNLYVCCICFTKVICRFASVDPTLMAQN